MNNMDQLNADELSKNEDIKYSILQSNSYSLQIRNSFEEEFNEDLAWAVANVHTSLTSNSRLVTVSFNATPAVLEWIKNEAQPAIFSKLKFDLVLELTFSKYGNYYEFTYINNQFMIKSISTDHYASNDAHLMFVIEFFRPMNIN